MKKPESLALASKTQRKSLGDILLAQRLITDEQLDTGVSIMRDGLNSLLQYPTSTQTNKKKQCLADGNRSSGAQGIYADEALRKRKMH